MFVKCQVSLNSLNCLYFDRPTATLVRYLEKLSCSSHLDDTDPTFVFRAMLDLGIGLPRLFDIYDKTYKVKVSC